MFPSRASFDGVPVEHWDTFDSESFRAQINMALDWIWFAREPWEIEDADKMLTLFIVQGDERRTAVNTSSTGSCSAACETTR